MSTPLSLPPLHDHHTHPLLYAAFLQAVDLSSVNNLDEACERILFATSADSEQDMLVAHGWKDNFFQFPAERLDALPPVAIFNLSLHWLVTNLSGKALLKRRYGNDVDRISDSHWYECNFRRILNWFAVMGTSPQSLVNFYDHLETLGIHSAEELLLVNEQEIDWFLETGLMERTRLWADPQTAASLPAAKQQLLSGTKLFLDGALGSRTAAISQAYLGTSDATGNTNLGMLMYDDAALHHQLECCRDQSPNLAVHAIGDRAIEQLLRVLEARGNARTFEQVRMEHAQLISLPQARRAQELGIVLSMQPNFSIDSLHYSDRLAEPLCQANNPFRMLIDNAGFVPGEDLIFGSDGMPHGAAEALRQATAPPLESQRLTQAELISGYTVSAQKVPS